MMGEAPARINLELCSGMGRDFYREVGSHPMDEPISYVRADIVDELRAALQKSMCMAEIIAEELNIEMGETIVKLEVGAETFTKSWLAVQDESRAALAKAGCEP